jgi:cobalt-zinc-cadmium efflux system outer membrane protein
MPSPSLLWAGCAVLFGVLFASPASLANAPDTVVSVPLSPDAAVSAALSVHPAVQSAEAQLVLAQGNVAALRIPLANPRLAAETSGSNKTSFSVSQAISPRREGWLYRLEAKAKLEAREQALIRARLSAAAQTRLAYVAAVIAGEKVRVAKEGVRLSKRLSQAVTRQSEEGLASTLNLNLTRLAEVQAATKLLEARQLEAAALRELASQTALPLGATGLMSDPLAAVPAPRDREGKKRSDVRAAQADLRASQARLRAQRAASIPPLEIGLFINIEDGQKVMGPTVSLELPLFNRNQSGRSEALGQQRIASARFQGLKARASTDILTAENTDAIATELMDSLVAEPAKEAKQALDSIDAGYQAGEIDLSTTVLLQAEVLDSESAALTFLGQVAQARLDLLLQTEDAALLGEQQ